MAPLNIPTNRPNRTTTTTRTPHPLPLRPTSMMNPHLPVCQTSPTCPTPTPRLLFICSIDERRDIGENLQIDLYEKFAGNLRNFFAAGRAAVMDMEGGTMATASEASCGPRTMLTPSFPAKATESEVVPKALAGERTQKVAMAKLCGAEFATQTSTFRRNALRIATGAEAQVEVHQHLSLD